MVKSHSHDKSLMSSTISNTSNIDREKILAFLTVQIAQTIECQINVNSFPTLPHGPRDTKTKTSFYIYSCIPIITPNHLLSYQTKKRNHN